jgi:hypothetical protein
MSSASSIYSKISAFLTGDIIFLLCVFAVLFLLVMYFGKARFISLVLAFYPATFLYKSFPLMDKFLFIVGDRGVMINKILIFLLFMVPIYLVINKYVSHYGEYGGAEGIVRTGGFVASILILVLIFSYTTVSLNLIHDFGSQIDGLFTGEGKIFWWSLAPLALLGFL